MKGKRRTDRPPVAGKLVSAGPKNAFGRGLETKADEQGQFVFSGTVPGLIYIVDSFEKSLREESGKYVGEIVGGSTGNRLVVTGRTDESEAAGLRVHVRTEDGMAAPPAVRIAGRTRTRNADWKTVSWQPALTAGCALLPIYVDTSEWELSCRASGSGWTRIPAEIRKGDLVETEVVLARVRYVDIQVSDAAVRPCSGIEVRCIGEDMLDVVRLPASRMIAVSTTDEKGTARSEVLPGPYRIEAMLRGEREWRCVLTGISHATDPAVVPVLVRLEVAVSEESRARK